MNFSKGFSLFIVIICYLITFPLSSYLVKQNHQSNFFLDILFWDFLESTLLFGFAIASNSISIIDVYWKLAPLFQISVFIFNRYQNANVSIKHLISFLLVALWALRLLYNYLRSWPGLNFLDFRVKYYKDKTGMLFFWPMAYIIFFIVSGFLLYLAKLSILIFAVESDNDFRYHILLGWFTMLSGVMVETLADNQLYNFRKSKKKTPILDEGLWYYCRHPNYLGEMLFWWGVFLTSLEIFDRYPWMILGPLVMSSMFAFGSGPWMDQHLSERRKSYLDYMKINRSLMIPWFRTERFDQNIKEN